MSAQNNPPLVKLTFCWPIFFIAASMGLMISWAILSGDLQGRVNLLYLLLVFLVLPISSLLIGILSLAQGKGLNLARLLQALPIWSPQLKQLQRKIRQLKVDKHWFFYQSQLAALGFSLANLAVFFLLLIATDVNFVWRSTLLQTSDLLPWLKVIAAPWFWWPDAQPQLDMLTAIRDSRLTDIVASVDKHSFWWKFILAVQVFYCLLPRFIFLMFSRWWFNRKVALDVETQLASATKSSFTNTNRKHELAPLVNQLTEGLSINNWGNIDLQLLQKFSFLDFSEDKQLNAGPLASEAEQRVAERWQGKQLILVKAWEPPMAELSDFMQNGKGYLWPIDWQTDQLVALREIHLQEWRRFVAPLSQWKVFTPEDLIPDNLLSNTCEQ